MPTTRAGALTPVTANARRISGRMTVTLEDVAQIGQAKLRGGAAARTSRWR